MRDICMKRELSRDFARSSIFEKAGASAFYYKKLVDSGKDRQFY